MTKNTKTWMGSYSCPQCKKTYYYEDFEDDIELREFMITYLCGKCQRKIFGRNNHTGNKMSYEEFKEKYNYEE